MKQIKVIENVPKNELETQLQKYVNENWNVLSVIPGPSLPGLSFTYLTIVLSREHITNWE